MTSGKDRFIAREPGPSKSSGYSPNQRIRLSLITRLSHSLFHTILPVSLIRPVFPPVPPVIPCDLYFPNDQWVSYGPYPVLSVNLLRKTCTSRLSPTTCGEWLPYDPRNLYDPYAWPWSPRRSPSSLSISVCSSSLNTWQLYKQNTITVEKKRYRIVFRDPCRFQKQTTKNVTYFFQVLLYLLFL